MTRESEAVVVRQQMPTSGLPEHLWPSPWGDGDYGTLLYHQSALRMSMLAVMEASRFPSLLRWLDRRLARRRAAHPQGVSVGGPQHWNAIRRGKSNVRRYDNPL